MANQGPHPRRLPGYSASARATSIRRARVHRGREYRYYACPVSDGRGRWLGENGEQR
jgi:hypothetical protein